MGKIEPHSAQGRYDTRSELQKVIKELYLIDEKDVKEIAEELNVSIEFIEKSIKSFKRPKRSKGEISMLDILSIIYPNHTIEEQYPFMGMFFDFYIERLRLVIE